MVLLKLQVVPLFEELRCKQQLMRAVTDYLSLRWLVEWTWVIPSQATPAHLYPQRSRLAVFRHFFE